MQETEITKRNRKKDKTDRQRQHRPRIVNQAAESRTRSQHALNSPISNFTAIDIVVRGSCCNVAAQFAVSFYATCNSGSGIFSALFISSFDTGHCVRYQESVFLIVFSFSYFLFRFFFYFFFFYFCFFLVLAFSNHIQKINC